VAVVTESFLPQVNGVTNSVLRVCDQLRRLGHDGLVVAPGRLSPEWDGFPVVRVPSSALPGYPDHEIARRWPGLEPALRDFRPDVVHLASPTLLGARALPVARRLGAPVVAVYQTDLAAYARRYGLGLAAPAVWWWFRRLHGRADRTLAPSRQAIADLQRHGVSRVVHWPRGVDLNRFGPVHRDDALRARLAPDGEVLVGYVGRLAREKQLHLLAGLDQLPGVRLVVVGDGPARGRLERLLPGATFLGLLGGRDLSGTFASLDLFVHAGAHETFCQAAQEALASGVPVVAPAAGGLLDLVQDGVTGRLFRPGSARELRAAVLDLVQDGPARARMALAARRSVLGRDWDTIGEQLIRHYHEVCSDTGGLLDGLALDPSLR
jgi:phosphatidylinositol alpha 1,6-mannosyltransferase